MLAVYLSHLLRFHYAHQDPGYCLFPGLLVVPAPTLASPHGKVFVRLRLSELMNVYWKGSKVRLCSQGALGPARGSLQTLRVTSQSKPKNT